AFAVCKSASLAIVVRPIGCVVPMSVWPSRYRDGHELPCEAAECITHWPPRRYVRKSKRPLAFVLLLFSAIIIVAQVHASRWSAAHHDPYLQRILLYPTQQRR